MKFAGKVLNDRCLKNPVSFHVFVWNSQVDTGPDHVRFLVVFALQNILASAEQLVGNTMSQVHLERFSQIFPL